MNDNALTFERNIDVVTSEIIMLRDQARSMAIAYISMYGIMQKLFSNVQTKQRKIIINIWEI